MSSASVDINPRTDSKGFPRRALVVRIRDRKLALEDEMRGQTAVRMRRVVGVTVACSGQIVLRRAFSYRRRLDRGYSVCTIDWVVVGRTGHRSM